MVNNLGLPPGIKGVGSGIRRVGSGITALGSGIRDHGIGISSYFRGQGSGCTIFVGLGTKTGHAFGIKDQKFTYKYWISIVKTYLVTTLGRCCVATWTCATEKVCPCYHNSDCKDQGHPMVSFGEYLFGRPRLA